MYGYTTPLYKADNYRLRDGRSGTYEEALLEVIEYWELKSKEANEKLEKFRLKLEEERNKKK